MLAPVDKYKFNQWFLYGFGGNAAEWVWDLYEQYEASAVSDPTGATEGVGRVFRGVSFWSGPRDARMAVRDWDEPGIRVGHLGFRLSRSCPLRFYPLSVFGHGEPGETRSRQRALRRCREVGSWAAWILVYEGGEIAMPIFALRQWPVWRWWSIGRQF